MKLKFVGYNRIDHLLCKIHDANSGFYDLVVVDFTMGIVVRIYNGKGHIFDMPIITSFFRVRGVWYTFCLIQVAWNTRIEEVHIHPLCKGGGTSSPAI